MCCSSLLLIHSVAYLHSPVPSHKSPSPSSSSSIHYSLALRLLRPFLFLQPILVSPSSGPLHHLHTPTAGEAVSESVSESFGKVFPYFKAKKETVWPGLRHALKTDHHNRPVLPFSLPPFSCVLLCPSSSFLHSLLFQIHFFLPLLFGIFPVL